MNEDFNAILRTIKEVEASLERRFARAEGTLLMIWGLVGASIFAFYQLTAWNHDTYHAALGPWLTWIWIGPMALGYVASAIVGARVGRMGIDETRKRNFRRGAIPGLLIAALATILVLTQRYDFIYGGVTLISGATCIVFARKAPPGTVRAVSFAVGAAMSGIGLALLAFWQVTWAPGAASLTFLVGYLLLGTVRYRLGR